MKDVVNPAQPQRAMGRRAEALRETRARIIEAERSSKRNPKAQEAAAVIMQSPAGLECGRCK